MKLTQGKKMIYVPIKNSLIFILVKKVMDLIFMAEKL
jgi:hypothetical protein